jgi:hypothetical protein
VKDFRLYKRVDELEKLVDSLQKDLYHVKQQNQELVDMLRKEKKDA